MSTVVEIGLMTMALMMLIPAVVLLVECIAARRDGGVPEPAIGSAPRVAVLVPAHDERAGIGATITGLLGDLAAGDRLIVVADNCTDGTADAVRKLAQSDSRLSVIERSDPLRRGKGYAISFGVKFLEADPPEVVVLVDADCRLSSDAISTLARRAVRLDAPIQGEYLLAAPARSSALARVSALALVVRNQVRPRGLDRLGYPCLLTGSGMAFPWSALRDAPATEGHLVEDMVLGLELALRGRSPRHCGVVRVSSELPEDRGAGFRQRRRWEHGQLQVLSRYGLRLLGVGLRSRRADLLALALDLMVPPLALLVGIQGALALASLGALVAGVSSALPLVISVAALLIIATAVSVAWWRFARDTIRAVELLFVPVYLLWKIPLYVSLAIKGRQRIWERTARAAPGVDDSSRPKE